MSSLASLSAIHTAIVTPFRNGKIDEGAFEKICKTQMEVGAGIVVGSDIGEGLTLDETELVRLVQIASSVSSDRVSILCYVEASMRRDFDEMARLLTHRGATSIICRFPRFSSFSETEAYACVRRMCHMIDRPVFFEHREIEGRFVMSEQKIDALYRAGLIHGLVLCELDPTGLLSRQASLGDEFIQLIDDDRLAACHIASGGQGWITAVGNIAPQACMQLLSTWNSGDVAKFRVLRDVLSSASIALNCTHPSVGLKAILKQSGVSDGTVRNPLRCLQSEAEQHLLKALTAVKSLDRVARRGRD
jgi:4-hydroxy-tetrahydrodipicolinate synthase